MRLNKETRIQLLMSGESFTFDHYDTTSYRIVGDKVLKKFKSYPEELYFKRVEETIERIDFRTLRFCNQWEIERKMRSAAA